MKSHSSAVQGAGITAAAFRSGYESIFKILRIHTVCGEDVLDLFKSVTATICVQQKDFPHEMGVLLGYPLEDVKGFINNRGRIFLYTGYWKVYSDLQQKMDLFGRLNRQKNR